LKHGLHVNFTDTATIMLVEGILTYKRLHDYVTSWNPFWNVRLWSYL